VNAQTLTIGEVTVGERMADPGTGVPTSALILSGE
jgi:hypothetical protein